MPPVNKQDIPSDGVVGEFLGISAGGVLDWLPVSGGSGTGDLLAANNLSELTPTAGTARTNLGLGTGDSPTFANLTLTSPSLASSAPVTISQTWGTTGTYTAAKVNVTETATANAASLLLDLQVGTVSQFSVSKDGQVNLKKLGNSVNASVVSYDSGGLKSGFYFPNSGLDLAWTRANGSVWGVGFNRCSVNSSARFSWSSSSDPLGTEDTILLRDGAANTLALRNGAAAQTFRVYNTYSDGGINYERGEFVWSGSTFYVQTVNLGTGQTRPLSFGGQSMAFRTNSGSGLTERMAITAAGNVGIGTTAPGAKLDVAGGTVRIEAGSAQGFGERVSVLTFYRSDLPTTYLNKITSSVSGILNQAAITIDIANGPSTTVTPFQVTADQTVGLGGNITNNALLGASMVVKAGNVGIGTTAPVGVLDVRGANAIATGVQIGQTSAGVGNFITLHGSATSGGASQIIGNFNSTEGPLILGTFTNRANQLYLAVNGNVGIGTTSPTSKLDVAGLITATGIAANGTNSPRVYALGDSTSTRGLEFFTGGNALYYREGGGTSLAMYPSGIKLNSVSSLGWCTTTPDGGAETFLLRDEPYHLALRNGTNGGKFSVYGTYPGAAWERFTITAPTSGNVLLGTYKGTGGIARGLELQADGTTRMLITATGAIIQRPLASVTPPNNGDLVVEATSNTTLTFKLKGTDGTVRSGTITLSV